MCGFQFQINVYLVTLHVFKLSPINRELLVLIRDLFLRRLSPLLKTVKIFFAQSISDQTYLTYPPICPTNLSDLPTQQHYLPELTDIEVADNLPEHS